MSEMQLRALMCEVGRRLWQKDLVGGAEGNISVRLSSRQILCTPTGISKGHMRPSDLVIIDNHGKPAGEGQPSSEIKLHLRIFASRKDCQAVIHAHPPIATAFALAGEDIPDDLLPESAFVLGSVATVPFGEPGTEDLPNKIEPLLEDHKAFLLANHGAVVMGADLTDALFRMETLERVARLILNARLLGEPQPMPDKYFQHVLKVALHGRLSS
ncbi:MAG TPA: class II aldolase/adducin family protein [Fimbriimonas sp.]|nr:class II aldolase/adducin family protein [Fimbriimonas sp.]